MRVKVHSGACEEEFNLLVFSRALISTLLPPGYTLTVGHMMTTEPSNTLTDKDCQDAAKSSEIKLLSVLCCHLLVDFPFNFCNSINQMY